MPTVTIIVAIVCLIGVLVSYASVSQTIQNRRERRIRLISALKSRSRNFKFMLNGFPAGFLSKELTIIVQRSLADTCEQLSKLEPKDPAHVQDLQTISSQMNESQRQTAPATPINLENPQQVKEVRVCLEELHKYILHLDKKRTLPRSQVDIYRVQIKQMVLRVTVDSYFLNGRQAVKNGKTKLAIHHFELALKLLLKNARPGEYDGKIAQLKETLGQLHARLKEEDPTIKLSTQQQSEKEDVANEWDKFSDKSDIWKKKNIYD
ncbi:MAG: hypothetical protein ACI9Y1_000821 [Lentisphaeria bacterium]|jgi:hypothetical protein